MSPVFRDEVHICLRTLISFNYFFLPYSFNYYHSPELVELHALEINSSTYFKNTLIYVHCSACSFRLESLTRRLSLKAPQSIHFDSRAGSIDMTSHGDIKFDSIVGSVSVLDLLF